MRHGEGFESARAAYRQRAMHMMPQGLVESARSETAYPYRNFGKGEPAYSGADFIDVAAAGDKYQLDDDGVEALMARLATTLHVNGIIREIPNSTGEDCNDCMPAAYTYLAQLAIHDMTFSALRENASGKAANLAGPMLDLGTLYGDGPAGNDLLFEHNAPGAPRGRFRIGYMSNGKSNNGNGFLVGPQEDIARFPLGPTCGHLDPKSAHEPLLADSRNADNLILSQLILLFMKLHNIVYDRLLATPKYKNTPSGAFAASRRIVVACYQTILRDDLLKRLLHDVEWNRYFDEKAISLTAGPRVSREAAFAVLRFGHSMARPLYNYNGQHEGAELGTLLEFFGLPLNGGAQFGLPLDSSWIIDWSRFLDLAGDGTASSRAHRFAPAMNDTLRTHAAILAKPSASTKDHVLGLAFRTLMKGVFHQLPTGQAVAGKMQLAAITPQQITDRLKPKENNAASIGKIQLDATDLNFLSEHTPLFVYILLEAELSGGAKLGSIGGDFTAYTFAVCGLRSRALPPDITADWKAAKIAADPPTSMAMLVSITSTFNQNTT